MQDQTKSIKLNRFSDLMHHTMDSFTPVKINCDKLKRIVKSLLIVNNKKANIHIFKDKIEFQAINISQTQAFFINLQLPKPIGHIDKMYSISTKALGLWLDKVNCDVELYLNEDYMVLTRPHRTINLKLDFCESMMQTGMPKSDYWVNVSVDRQKLFDVLSMVHSSNADSCEISYSCSGQLWFKPETDDNKRFDFAVQDGQIDTSNSYKVRYLDSVVKALYLYNDVEKVTIYTSLNNPIIFDIGPLRYAAAPCFPDGYPSDLDE